MMHCIALSCVELRLVAFCYVVHYAITVNDHILVSVADRQCYNDDHCCDDEWMDRLLRKLVLRESGQLTPFSSTDGTNAGHKCA